MSDEFEISIFYLCTSLVLSSDFVQSMQLKSITIWQSIFPTSLSLKKLGQKLSLALDHLINLFNIERHILHVLAPLDSTVKINPF